MPLGFALGVVSESDCVSRPSLCIWAAAINEKGSDGAGEEAEDPNIEDGCDLENGTMIAIIDLEGSWCHSPAAEAVSLRQ